MKPMNYLKLPGILSGFKNNHPKMIDFARAAYKIADEDAVIEITMTTKNGSRLKSNFKLNKRDMELLSELDNLRKQK